jgi:hypothetical protein
MRLQVNTLFVVAVLATVGALFLSSCATSNTTQAPPAYGVTPTAPPGTENESWPVVFSDSMGSYTVYRPQCDSWDGHLMTGRSAVAIQPYGLSQPTYGVVKFNAITLVDKSTQIVSLAGLNITGVDLPSNNNQKEDYLATIRNVLPKCDLTLSEDRFEKSMAVVPPPKTERLVNTPPHIIISTRPAVLVSIDGPPAWRPVPGTSLQRAINTRVLLLKDPSGHCYLHIFDGYLQADSLMEHWQVAAQLPEGTAEAEKQAVDSGQVDLMQGAPDPTTHKEPSLQGATVPDVFVATTPGELIIFNGSPQYAPIPGTELLYAGNTSGNVFKLVTSQENYILISGRWYRASSLDGPWKYVPGSKLPRDFANIPDSSPKENVKASVPGTTQAEEALLANSIPQSAEIARTNQMENPQIDGAMQLAPIEGTPLFYVVNSAIPILEVDPQSWYACQDGIWYFATSANGPWAVATSVPSVIYTIPTSSPLHYVTYVQVYGSTADLVYEGYTSGYFGTEIEPDGTVVYGTGYDYSPWIGTIWYESPVTWGWGFDDCWTPWWGWGFDCGFGWGWWYPGFGFWAFYPPYPCWGGYRCWHDYGHDGWRDWDRGDMANTGGDFYHHDAFAAAHFGQNGFAGSYGRAYNSRTGRLSAGQWARTATVTGSAWNRGGHGSFAHNNTWGGAMDSAHLRNWAASERQWNQSFYSPRQSGLSYHGGGWQGGAGRWNGGGYRGGGGGFHGGGGFGGHGGGFGGGHGGGFGGGHGGGGGGGHGGGR